MWAFKLKKAVAPYRCDHSVGFRVRIECETQPNSGLSSKIFAYLPGGDVEDHFNHVCNVLDMKECPEDAPSEGKWPKWYRLNYVDLFLPNAEVAYDFINKVQEDVDDLYKNMHVYNQLLQQDDYYVPEE